ncbi:GIY-YIG nuclease family protein [Halpernia sp.]|uniref:GIY-YIG nuclease family protein n=1 Tax=Halpernia sp. TaxID=2782209 RepID=UPI003A922444
MKLLKEFIHSMFYILTNPRKIVLYTGVTNNLHIRFPKHSKKNDSKCNFKRKRN